MKTQKKIAAIGDPHGCIKEFSELLSKLEHHSLDEIWVLGDYVDRGPDSGAVVELARRKGIKGIKGNHESTILNYAKNPDPRREERLKTYQSIRSKEDWLYLENLPELHVDDDVKAVFVHGGLWAGIPLHKQPKAVMYAQMIKPYIPGDVEWWGTSEEELFRSKGYVRWYEICDEPYLVCYGHSVFPEPFRYNQTLGLDTGCVFGGSLSAVILPSEEIIQVKAKKTYYQRQPRP